MTINIAPDWGSLLKYSHLSYLFVWGGDGIYWKDEFAFIPRKCVISQKYYWLTTMKQASAFFRHEDNIFTKEACYIHPKQFAIAKLRGWL